MGFYFYSIDTDEQQAKPAGAHSSFIYANYMVPASKGSLLKLKILFIFVWFFYAGYEKRRIERINMHTKICCTSTKIMLSPERREPWHSSLLAVLMEAIKA